MSINLDVRLVMKKKIKFIDLFAGIGGFHVALKSLGMECVFTSEIDIHARKTYSANFKDKYLNDPNLFAGDIWKVDFNKIPDFDILCAGFPCQPFSQAGHKRGFKDNNDGNLFFSIEQILKIKKPKAYFLENVRHLKNHDDGKTFKVIYSTLQKLGYSFDYKIIKASEFGLPQHRPRIYMVGFYKPYLKDMYKELPFTFPKETPLKKTMSNIFKGKVTKELNSNEERKIGFTLRVGGGRSPINDRRNWDGYIVNNKVIRINSNQGLEMMGFPKSFKMPVTENQAMKQLGNSVAVNVVKAVADEIKFHLETYFK
jgi:DNA (cytosine-5)-methyltransferase 1